MHLLSARRLSSVRIRALIPFLLISSILIIYLLLPDQPKIPPNASYGLLDDTQPTSRLAIATFLSAGDKPPVSASAFSSNAYLTATRTLLYQLLHGPDTRINTSASNIDVLVLVTPGVPLETRKQLSREGAVVIEAQPIPLRWWIRTGVTRWKDQFLKLRLLQQTQYNRLLFIDADTLLTARIDTLFAEREVIAPAPTIHRYSKNDEVIPNQYMFAARSDNQFTGERDHPFPPLNTDVFSAGFWVAAPSQELFAYLLSVMGHYRRFDPHTMEQSLLNYAFRRGGPMPWRELHYQWSATWPSGKDVKGGVVSLHEKFWKTGPEELQVLWTRRREEMEKFWGGGGGGEREKEFEGRTGFL
ncbi:hypothetical protein E4U17_003040 [Claviceps sp. LM77 group G4]|nr:hypothetical protein E4U17_003040 [Claviceps sp. LM77 group G4]